MYLVYDLFLYLLVIVLQIKNFFSIPLELCVASILHNYYMLLYGQYS